MEIMQKEKRRREKKGRVKGEWEKVEESYDGVCCLKCSKAIN